MKRVRGRKGDVGDGGWDCWTVGTKIGWDSQVRRDVQRIRETPGEQQHTRSQLVIDGPTEEGRLVTRTRDGDQDRWAKGTPWPREKGTGGIPLLMVTNEEKRASDSILRSPHAGPKQRERGQARTREENRDRPQPPACSPPKSANGRLEGKKTNKQGLTQQKTRQQRTSNTKPSSSSS